MLVWMLGFSPLVLPTTVSPCLIPTIKCWAGGGINLQFFQTATHFSPREGVTCKEQMFPPRCVTDKGISTLSAFVRFVFFASAGKPWRHQSAGSSWHSACSLGCGFLVVWLRRQHQAQPETPPHHPLRPGSRSDWLVTRVNTTRGALSSSTEESGEPSVTMTSLWQTPTCSAASWASSLPQDGPTAPSTEKARVRDATGNSLCPV